MSRTEKVLAAAAVIQTLLLGVILFHRAKQRHLIEPATNVERFIQGDTVKLSTVQPATSPYHVILAFRTSCPFVSEVAGTWREWTESNRNAAVFLATDEPVTKAGSFVDSVGWHGVLLGEGNERGSDLQRLTLRTPWVFVLDRSGVIVSDFNGALLPALSLRDGRLDTAWVEGVSR